MIDKEAIIADALDGLKHAEIARKHGCSQAYVGKIMKEFRAKDVAPKPLTYAQEATGEFTKEPEPDPMILSDAEVVERAWKLSSQDREQIYYGIVEMGNPPSEVGPAFGVDAIVAIKVVEMERMRRGQA